MKPFTVKKVTEHGKVLSRDFRDRLLSLGFIEEERGYVICLSELLSKRVLKESA